MILKKVLNFLLIFCMIFSFVACGGRSRDDDDDSKSSKASSQKYDKEDDKDKKDDESNKAEKDDVDNEEDEEDKGNKGSKSGKAGQDDVLAKYDEVDLPKNYPEDIYPIYKDARVWVAFVDKSSGYETFSVSAVCKDDAETVSTFYKNIVTGSDDFNDYSMNDLYTYSGKYGGYEYAISCAPEDSNDDYTMFTLMLKKLPSAETLLKKLNEGELPDDYPSDYFPIIEDAAIANASESERDGKVSYSLNLYTDKTFKEILAFYENAIGQIENKSKSSSTDDFEIRGEAHGYSFNINGYKVERDGIDLVQYWISLQPLD